MSLSRSREHDFPSDERPVTCTRCGYTLREGVEKRDLCPGMDQTSQLANTGSLDRSTPLSPVSDTNSGRAHQKDEQFREYVRQLPCLVCGASPPSDPHHVRTWGSGHGDWLDDGSGNLASLCRKHHRELDSPGSGPETFQAEHGIDLQAKAREIGEAYQKQSEQMREDKDGL